MPATPTTEGSIVAYVAADIGDLKRGMVEADAAVKAVTDSDPTVYVRADIADAMTKLEAVRAASDKAGASSKNNLTYMGAVAAGIGVLVPMIAPLTGYVVGVGGAFAGMGAAGITAVLGIKNAMATGNAMGDQYSAGLRTLTGDLSQLSQTSAVNMLGAFGQAITQIDSAMPQLNGEIGQFSGMLGVAGNSVLRGVINAFEVLNPLFVASGQYIEVIAAGFASWTSDGGLQKFATYAMQQLPLVEQTLGALAGAIMHILDALAPLGVIGLTIIKNVSDAINLIPTNDLTELAIGAGLAFGAFKLWPSLPGTIVNVTKALVGMGSAEKALTASSAGVVGGIAALGGTMAYFVGQALDSVRVSMGLQQSVDTLNKSLSQTNLKGLQQDTHASVLGIQTDVSQLGEVVNSGWASGFLNNVMGMYHGVLQINPMFKLMGLSAGDLTGHMSDLDTAMAQLVASGHTDQAATAYKTLAAQTDGSKQAIANLKGYLPQYEAAIKSAGTATATDRGQLDDLGRTADQVSAAFDKLSQKIAGFGQTNLSVTQAQVQFQQSIADTTAAIAKNGATLDLSTQQGRDNTTALDGIASSTIALVASQSKAHDSQATLTGSMQTGRAAFIAAAGAAGDTAAQVATLADQYGLIPAKVTTAINVTGAVTAADAAASVAAAVASIQRNVDIAINLHGATNLATSGGLRLAFSGGGPVPNYLAAGGPTVNYLASGGNPFQPQGTDTVPAMLTPKEFVVKQSSASYLGPLLPALNDNPQQTLQQISKPVVHNHYAFTIVSDNPEQIFQGMTNHLFMLGA